VNGTGSGENFVLNLIADFVGREGDKGHDKVCHKGRDEAGVEGRVKYETKYETKCGMKCGMKVAIRDKRGVRAGRR
jgi:hypothetical protein